MRRLLLPIAMVLLLGFAAGCGDDDGDGGDSASDGGGAATDTATQPAQEPKPKATPRRQGECVEVAQPAAKPDGGEERPTEELSAPAEVTFHTNCGRFTATIDPEGGLTSASFVQLAENGFYKNTIFHRIAPGFVIQGGDPTATGTGGPGYTTRDAPPSDAQYPKYTVAMAKGGQEPDGTSGSQFFVMTGDLGLPPQYAIVGEVTEGTEVIDAIGKLGDPSEQPTQIVKIEKVTVSGG